MSAPRTPAAAGAVVAVAAAVALTGCAANNLHLPSPLSAGSASPTVAGPSAAPTAGDSASPVVSAPSPDAPGANAPTPNAPSPTASGPKPLSGRQLKPLLPTSATLPAGWTMHDSSETDTGDNFEDEPDPMLLGNPCNWLTSASGNSLAAGYETAHAEELVSEDVNEAGIHLGSYFPGTATKQLALIRAYADKCKTYTGQDWDKKPVPHTVTVTAVADLGDEAIELKNVPTGPYAARDVLAVRIGDKLLILDGNDIVERLPHIRDLAVPIAKHIKEVSP
ncbi:hypothetical protein ABTZ03_17550 [Kitasatospora sp. NPDC096077]|uniref:hypothetical protein n=1 Tax=Kitasatospora sp. NPDC096077 TaxID=3155544 RepID=UPI003321D12F